MTRRPLNLLLADDSPSDLLLIEMALDSTGLPYELQTALDGLEVMEALQDRLRASHLPDFLLLDLNMPRMGSLEVLDVLKVDEDLRSIPVIVLTTSRAENDIWRSYDLHANAYIPKPVSVSEFVDVIRSLGNFWFTKAALPPDHKP